MRRFRDKDAERLFRGHSVRRLPADIQRRARMRVQRVMAAAALSDLRIPASHRLETLRGERKGQHSIRINDQWRVCFRWTEQGAVEIEIADYH
ncbi:MAG: type II toxin-antitoxin system RelE/ParE family toxin [Gammaproteobacteria bacterium]|nr:type II toxin-antitoxin system RelE/ParE family toxin [Gammaproteobacteria bacterium]